MHVLAPAKINLTLRVAPVGLDGFHPLNSWMVTVGLFDTLTITPLQPSGIQFSCDDGSLPTDDRNLVVRAAKLIEFRTKARRCAVGSADGIAIHLEKRIPSAAGLGGGSSDAARALLALNEVWNLGLSREQLVELAARLGSDVPFFLFGPSSVCTGRGEIVRPIDPPAVRYAVLIFPGIAMPTARVYAEFDRRRPGKEDAVNLGPVEQGWASLSADALLPRLVNDLESPAFLISPELAKLRADLEVMLTRPVRMSGSGSTLFTLYDDRDAAEHAARSITGAGTRAATVEIAPQLRDDLTLGN